MNEEQLRALFERQARQEQEPEPVPESARPDPVAKKRAILTAMKAFDEAQAAQQKNNFSFVQGILQSLRLTRRSKIKAEDETMKKKNQPWLLGAMTTAVVAVFAVLLVDFEPHEIALEDAAMSESGTAEELIITGIGVELEVAADMARAEASSAYLAEELTSPSEAMASPSIRSKVLAPSSPAEGMVLPEPMPVYRDEHRDKFEAAELNPIKRVGEEPVSTFSIDVDTASYAFVRSSLNQGRLPVQDAVRIEEMLNYFDYRYPQPVTREEPFTPTISVVDSPWSAGKKIMHIGIKGYDIDEGAQPRSNLVFLLDVSGSMNAPDKLPLVKQSMNLLLSKLKSDDTVAIVVYAGAAGTVLESTPVKEKAKILAALSRLSAGGSTAGSQGIELAYQLAEANFDKDAVNRVILATDGDFNVGISDVEQLKGFVEGKREKGIFLSVLGFGRGNYNDQLMQALAQNGNGVAAYIDSLGEAQKVLVDEATSALFPIAKDVKIQLEFNPAAVSEYRLVGYETRALAREDFNNDRVDAGDIGAGHTVTAMYEFTPLGSGAEALDDLRYQKKPTMPSSAAEYAFLKLRYKLPDETKSRLISEPVTAQNSTLSSTLGQEINFAIAVASFAQLLKDPKYMGAWTYDQVIELAQATRGEDLYGYRAEFVQLVRKAQVAKAL